MTIKDITSCLEDFAHLSLQEDYDNSGLLIGDPDTEIDQVLITLDVTDDVLQEAIQKKCQLVISHHPLIFHGLKKFSENDPVQRLAIKAIKNDISVYAMHTNLDNSLNGLNRIICEKLGIQECMFLDPAKGQLAKLSVFCPGAYADKVRESLFEAGAGHIGNYDCCSYNIQGSGSFRALDKANPFVGELNKIHFEEEVKIEVVFPLFLEQKLIKALKLNHPYEEIAYDLYPLINRSGLSGSGMVGFLENEMKSTDFLEKVKSVMGIPVLRHSKIHGSHVIRKVAVCTGSGSFLIPRALGCSADVFLTSDLKYHDYFTTGDKMIMADIGHYESERFVKDLIHDILIRKFPTFAFLISGINTNPITYF